MPEFEELRLSIVLDDRQAIAGLKQLKWPINHLLLAAAAVALALTSNSANARINPVGDERIYQCAGFKHTPPEAPERDPVLKTIIDIKQNFLVEHQTLAGVSYIRSEQYRDIRTWTKNGEHYWSGISIKIPIRTMIGHLAWDDSRGIAARRYIEKLFNGKRLESTVVSTCVWSEPD